MITTTSQALCRHCRKPIEACEPTIFCCWERLLDVHEGVVMRAKDALETRGWTVTPPPGFVGA